MKLVRRSWLGACLIATTTGLGLAGPAAAAAGPQINCAGSPGLTSNARYGALVL